MRKKKDPDALQSGRASKSKHSSKPKNSGSAASAQQVNRYKAAARLGDLRNLAAFVVDSGLVFNWRALGVLLGDVISRFPAGRYRLGRFQGAYHGWPDGNAVEAIGRIAPRLPPEVLDAIAAGMREREERRGAGLIWPDAAGEMLGVDAIIRAEVGLRTIRANDRTFAQQQQEAKERRRARKEHTRRAAGAKPHAESAARLEPWKAAGMSQRTFYRRPLEERERIIAAARAAAVVRVAAVPVPWSLSQP